MLRPPFAPAACGLLLACGLAAAAEDDPVRKRLEVAKAAYEGEAEKFMKAINGAFEKRLEVARKEGNKRVIDQLKVERQGFAERGDMPKSLAPATLQRVAASRDAMERAFAAAVKDYTRAKKDAEAARVEEEWKDFRSRNGVPASPTRKALLGTWRVTMVNYNDDWTFHPDSSTTAANSTVGGGKWEVDYERKCVSVVWPNNPGVSHHFNLPLDPKRTTGEEVNGRITRKMEAVKVK